MTNEEYQTRSRRIIGRLTVITGQIDDIMSNSHERVSNSLLQPLIGRQQEIIGELATLSRDYSNDVVF